MQRTPAALAPSGETEKTHSPAARESRADPTRSIDSIDRVDRVEIGPADGLWEAFRRPASAPRRRSIVSMGIEIGRLMGRRAAGGAQSFSALAAAKKSSQKAIGEELEEGVARVINPLKACEGCASRRGATFYV